MSFIPTESKIQAARRIIAQVYDRTPDRNSRNAELERVRQEFALLISQSTWKQAIQDAENAIDAIAEYQRLKQPKRSRRNPADARNLDRAWRRCWLEQAWNAADAAVREVERAERRDA